jgi:hypothetical protein
LLWYRYLVFCLRPSLCGPYDTLVRIFWATNGTSHEAPLKLKGFLIPKADSESHEVQAAFSEIVVLSKHSATFSTRSWWADKSHLFIAVYYCTGCDLACRIWLVPTSCTYGLCPCPSHRRCSIPRSIFTGTLTLRTHILTCACLHFFTTCFFLHHCHFTLHMDTASQVLFLLRHKGMVRRKRHCHCSVKLPPALASRSTSITCNAFLYAGTTASFLTYTFCSAGHC